MARNSAFRICPESAALLPSCSVYRDGNEGEPYGGSASGGAGDTFTERLLLTNTLSLWIAHRANGA
eukprot:6068182-Amphidinium_carterae.1